MNWVPLSILYALQRRASEFEQKVAMAQILNVWLIPAITHMLFGVL